MSDGLAAVTEALGGVVTSTLPQGFVVNFIYGLARAIFSAYFDVLAERNTFTRERPTDANKPVIAAAVSAAVGMPWIGEDGSRHPGSAVPPPAGPANHGQDIRGVRS